MSEASYVHRAAGTRSTERPFIGSLRAKLALGVATLLGAIGYSLAQDAPYKLDPTLPEVRIQAERQADERVTRQVEQTLANDPWIFAEHVTVTTHHGVVRVEGIVQDTGEWFRIIRLARKVPGARRVDTSGLELIHNDPDGG